MMPVSYGSDDGPSESDALHDALDFRRVLFSRKFWIRVVNKIF